MIGYLILRLIPKVAKVKVKAIVQQVKYVMLLSHAKDVDYQQEGVYVSFARTLDDPRAWSAPTRILKGGTWYPQVLGLEDGAGTDRTAGEWARFFMLGESRHTIRFIP